MDFKNGNHATRIVNLQHEDGSWGYFHTLSNPTAMQPITTEQALRRLSILGFTINDTVIQKAVDYMHGCLLKKEIPDKREKVHDWDIFVEMILSTWIRRFTLNDNLANSIADKWCAIVSAAFINGEYNHENYIEAYKTNFGITAKGGRLIDFVNFYPISLIAGSIDKAVEPFVLQYILNKKTGIYYIYDKALNTTPLIFQSKEASRYLSAIELLARFDNPKCKKKLSFVVDWLYANQMLNNKWDMGNFAKDGIYFPLSDYWRKEEVRIYDCTLRISKLLIKLTDI